VTQRDANGERIVDRNTFLPPDDTTDRLSKIERGYTLPQQAVLQRLETQEATSSDLADQIINISNTSTSVTTGGGQSFIPYGNWMAPGGYASGNPNTYSTVSVTDQAFYVIPYMCAAGTYDEWAFILHNDLDTLMAGCYSVAIYDAAGGKAGEFNIVWDGPAAPGPITGGGTVVVGSGAATLPADGTYWFMFASSGNSRWNSVFATRGINGPYSVMPLVATRTATNLLEMWPQHGLAGFGVYGSVGGAFAIPMPATLPSMTSYFPFSSVVPRVYLKRA
jgi:hypothetical protein